MPRKPAERACTPLEGSVSTRSKRRNRRRRRVSVGATLGVTPGRKQRKHLREAAALQDAVDAAEELDALAGRKTPKSRKGKGRKKVKTPKKVATAPPLPAAFRDDSPFMWNTIRAFDTPVAGHEGPLGNGVGRQWWETETKEDVPELDSKTPDQLDGAREDSAEQDRSDDADDPEDTDDREFLKDSYEGESENDLPPTEEDEFTETSDEDYCPDDGGDSSDTLSEDDVPDPTKGRAKTRGAERRSAGREPDSSPSGSSSSDHDDAGSDSHGQNEPRRSGNRAHRRALPRRQRRNRRSTRDRRYAAAVAAVLYKPPDESKNPPPVLKYGDPESKKAFQPKYTAYVAKHKSDQRNIPKAHRVLPRAVVECIEPNLLMQICRLELPKKYRTKRPENVSAMAVHRWVMGATKLPIDLEDAEGVKKMRALKCTIDAHEGLKNVQLLFMKVFEYQKTYHMKTSEEEIIKWLSNGIQPTQVKYTVLNALKVAGKKGRARRKRLTTFHRLLKKLAKKFYEAGPGVRP